MKALKKVLVYAVILCMAVTSVSMMPVAGNVIEAHAETGDNGLIALSKTTVNLIKGKKTTITLENASGDVTWTSKNKKVATVKDGVITAKKNGKTTITAKYNGKTYSCKVFVRSSSIKAATSSVKLSQKGSKKVTCTLKINDTIYYDIEDENIVSCQWSFKWNGNNTTLTIKAKKPGKTRVYVYSKKAGYFAIEVSVKAPWDDVEVEIPSSIGEQDTRQNRMSIDNYTFFGAASTYFKMKIDFTCVAFGKTGRTNWGEYFLCYDEDGNLIEEKFLYASGLAVGRSYTDTAYIPIGTKRIVFVEYPDDGVGNDDSSSSDSSSSGSDSSDSGSNSSDPSKWTKTELKTIQGYIDKAYEYADKAYSSISKGNSYESIAKGYMNMAAEQLEKARQLASGKVAFEANDGSDYFSEATISVVLAECQDYANGIYQSTAKVDCSSIRADVAGLRYKIAAIIEAVNK